MKQVKRRATNIKKSLEDMAKEIRAIESDCNNSINYQISKLDSKVYSADYIREEKKRIKAEVPKQYCGKINEARKKASLMIDYNLELIEDAYRRYINAPLSQKISNKLVTYQSLNYIPSKDELRFLQKDCKTYADRQILRQFCKTIVENAPSGSPHHTSFYEEIANETPEAVGLGEILTEYKQQIEYARDKFSGDGNLFYNSEDVFAVNSINVINKLEGVTNRFLEFFESASEIDPTVSNALTPEQIALIDALADPERPYSLENNLKEAFEKYPDIRPLLCKDTRYTEIIEKVEAEYYKEEANEIN